MTTTSEHSLESLTGAQQSALNRAQRLEAVLHETDDCSDVELLHRPPTAAVIVRRQLPAEVLAAAKLSVAGGPVWGLEAAGELQDALARFGHTLAEILADERLKPFKQQVLGDVEMVANQWLALVGERQLRFHMSVVDHDQCSKVHTDNQRLRALVTYHGPGTLVDRAAAPCGGPDLTGASVGDVVYLRGCRWEQGWPAARHVSPAVQGTGIRRILLRIDEPQHLVS